MLADKTLESHVTRKRSCVVRREVVGKVSIGELAGGLPYLTPKDSAEAAE